MNSSQLLFSFYGFLPELLLVATFVAGVVCVRRVPGAAWLPAVLAVGYAIAGALVLLVQLPLTQNSFGAEWLFKGPDQPFGYGMVMIDRMVVVVKLTLLLPLLGAEFSRWLTGQSARSASSIFQCSGLLGLWVVVGSDDLLTLFAGLELLAISTWRILQQQGEGTRRSVAISAAAIPGMLIGIGLVASFTGATNYATINNVTTAHNSAPIPVLPFVVGGLLLLVCTAVRGGLFPSFSSAATLPDSAPNSVRLFLLLLAPAGVLVATMRLLARAFPSGLPQLNWQPFVGGLTVMVMLLAVAAMFRGGQLRLNRLLAHVVTVSIAFMFLPILPLNGDGSPMFMLMFFGMMTSALAILLVLPTVERNVEGLTIATLRGVGRSGNMGAHVLFAGVLLLAGFPWGILFHTRPYLLFTFANEGYVWIAAMGAIAQIALWVMAAWVAFVGYRRAPVSGTAPPPSEAPSNLPSPSSTQVPIFQKNRWRVVVAVALLLANVLSAVPPCSKQLLHWIVE